jgi:prolyl oligopeptidase
MVDCAAGRILPDFLDRGLARGFGFQDACGGYYYCHDLLEDSAGNLRNDHMILFHRFGTDTQLDEVLLQIPRSSSSKLVLRTDDGVLCAALFEKRADRYFVDYYVATQDQHNTWNCVVQNVATPFNPFFCGQVLMVVSYDDAAKGKVVELDATSWHELRIIVPEWEAPIRSVTVVQNCIYVSYLVGTETAIRVWSMRGELISSLPLEKGCTWNLLPTYSTKTDELFLRCESFTKPPTLYSYRPKTGRRTVWSQNSIPSPKSSITHQTFVYLAKDDVPIAISLVGTAGLGLKGRPVIMTAYGGFGATPTPQFSTFVSIMLELGFVFALPEIRGGGVRGPEWHAAAQRRKRQVAVDDFLGAAEWLCSEGITCPEKLAIFGGSNSGLLVGAAISQRPHLFGAALCIAPLLDMVRYHLFDQAHVWEEEYGSADNREDFLALLGYSPYHCIDENQNYPPVLFVSGDQDTRCNPAHARKMTARLQNRAAQRSAILLDYSARRGHSPTMPLAVRIDALTMRIAFLCHELGIDTQLRHCSAGLVAQASLFLLRTEWYLRRHRDRPLQSALQESRNSLRRVERYSAEQISHAMDIACVFYFKTVKCLQRSVALAMLLRRHGFGAEVVIGGRIIPPKFHAWVEWKRVVLNDKPYTPELYQELERC